MARRYVDFASQENLQGGENRSLRNLLAAGQVLRAENLRIYRDRIAPVHGYAAFASSTMDLSTLPPYVEDGYFEDGYVAPAMEISGIFPDRIVDPQNLWVTTSGDVCTLALVTPAGVWTDKLTVGVGFPDWCVVPLGGTPTAPEVVLASNGDLVVGIKNLVTGAPTGWSTDFAFNAIAHWQNRLWGLANDHLVYFTEGQHESWSADPGDWQYLPVGDGSTRTRILATINQSLFVVKEKGIFRIDYIGAANELYQRVEVEPFIGCRWARGWTPILQGRALAFFGTDNKVHVWDGTVLHTLTSDLNIEAELNPDSEDYIPFENVWMTWDETQEILTVGFSDAATSWGWDIHFRAPLPDSSWLYAHTKHFFAHRFRSAAFTPLTTTGARRFFGAAAGTGKAILYRETPGTYSQAGADYTALLEFSALDLNAYQRQGQYPVLREFEMDVSASAAASVTLKHRNGDGAYSAGRAVAIASGEFRRLHVGIERPGLYPQVQLSSSAATGAWALRRVYYSGLLRKGRR